VISILACNVGRGLRNRPDSDAPAKAAEKVLGIDRFETPQAERRFSNLVHWGYGTSWGAVRGLLSSTPLTPKAATAVHGATVWGQAVVMLPTLGVAPPITQWGKEEVAIDVFHHAVYATATGITYELLSN
jgi:hypothetical protein